VPWADANRIPTSPDLVVEHLAPVAIASTVRDARGEVRDFMYEYVNPAFAAAVGEKPEALVGHRLLELYPSHVDRGIFDGYRRVVDEQVVWETDLPWFDERSASGYFHIKVQPLGDGYLVEGRDVTHELHLSTVERQRLANLIDTLPEPIVVLKSTTDERGQIVNFTYEHANRSFCDLSGTSRTMLIGNSLLSLHPSHRELGLFEECRQVVETGEPFVSELPWFEQSNSRSNLEVTVCKFNSGIVATGRDVTDRQLVEESLITEALSDPLTGLGNRRMLIDRIRHDLTRLERDGGEIAVLFIDLDRFKDVNDTLGHEVGDQVLREVARRLVAELRPSDTIARIGGDEFVVVVPRTNSHRDPAAIAERLLDRLAAPIEVASTSVRLGGSIGITTSHGNGDAEDLVRQADLAMYRAKRRHGDRFEFFDDHISTEVHQRVTMEQALRAAVERDEFEPWFQPEVDLRTGRIVGFEALARWRQPDGTMVAAAEWIAHAETSGLITRLDRALREKACAEFASWPRPGLSALVRLWLNVSARELVEADTAEVLLDTVRRAGLQPSDIGIEITETALAAEPVAANANLAALVLAGVRVAVDDFGTGFSSIASLRELQVDTVKIDRTFTRGVPGNGFDDAVVAATVALSDTLELGIVGEGIETAVQRDALEQMGCTTGQGYLFSAPIPGEQAAALITAGIPD